MLSVLSFGLNGGILMAFSYNMSHYEDINISVLLKNSIKFLRKSGKKRVEGRGARKTESFIDYTGYLGRSVAQGDIIYPRTGEVQMTDNIQNVSLKTIPPYRFQGALRVPSRSTQDTSNQPSTGMGSNNQHKVLYSKHSLHRHDEELELVTMPISPSIKSFSDDERPDQHQSEESNICNKTTNDHRSDNKPTNDLQYLSGMNSTSRGWFGGFPPVVGQEGSVQLSGINYWTESLNKNSKINQTPSNHYIDTSQRVRGFPSGQSLTDIPEAGVGGGHTICTYIYIYIYYVDDVSSGRRKY